VIKLKFKTLYVHYIVGSLAFELGSLQYEVVNNRSTIS